MEKVYKVSAARVWVNSVAGNVLLSGMLVWAIWEWSQGRADWKVYMLLVILPLVLISALVAHHQPERVEVTPESITFVAFGRRHTYKWAETSYLFVKRYGLGDRYLVNIGKFKAFGGRYWIPNHMEGSKELLAYLQEKQQSLKQR